MTERPGPGSTRPFRATADLSRRLRLRLRKASRRRRPRRWKRSRAIRRSPARWMAGRRSPRTRSRPVVPGCLRRLRACPASIRACLGRPLRPSWVSRRGRRASGVRLRRLLRGLRAPVRTRRLRRSRASGRCLDRVREGRRLRLRRWVERSVRACLRLLQRLRRGDVRRLLRRALASRRRLRRLRVGRCDRWRRARRDPRRLRLLRGRVASGVRLRLRWVGLRWVVPRWVGLRWAWAGRRTCRCLLRLEFRVVRACRRRPRCRPRLRRCSRLLCSRLRR